MGPADLTLGVTLAVLGAGLLHAGWNALLKRAKGGDPMLDTAAVVVGSAVWSILALPLAGLPDPAAWKFMAVSSLIHYAYYVTLSNAYRTGDLSFAYPIMRGTAPLITTLLGIVFLSELPSTKLAIGILLICAGIVSIAFVRRERHPPEALRWALANAAIIAAYTLIDGAGVRASGRPFAYVSWLLALEGLPYLAWLLWRRGRAAVDYVIRSRRLAIVGGLGSLAAYAIVLWAMTLAPVAAVAALRETSVLFAAVIGAVWLKEGFGVMRLVGAASVVAGIAALKL
ncbi:MAG TPA: EamA family transporter [Casimicrobiaceae bacterium]|nr:EamA family transporter [Casimicrobiaceae bacterium]